MTYKFALLLTGLATLWAAVVVFIYFYVGFAYFMDSVTEDGEMNGYFAFGWWIMIGLAALPIIIYSNLPPVSNRRY